MVKAKITVITVCYNAVNTLERTIQSVLNQTYDNIEYIIIDGGSTDGTVEIIKKYADTLTYWVSESDKGIYDAMNKGILHSTGVWINFMNAGDCFYSVDTVSKISCCFSPYNMVVYGNIIKCFKHYRIRSFSLNVERDIDAIDFFRNNIHHQAAFIKRGLFNKYGMYDTNYHLASDWKFFMEVVGIGGEKSEYVNMDVCLFAMDGVSTLRCNDYAEEINHILKNKFGSFYPYFKELSEYRNSKWARYALKLRICIRKTGLGHRIKNFFAFWQTLLSK